MVEDQYAGKVEEFLRESDIRVRIEPHIDRAIELINRTNQLNFTKQRLPEDPDQAGAILRAQLARFHVQAGLVHVADRFGDYGFVGFFLQEAMLAGRRLVHYCWSCRTLGMRVEAWLYDRMDRPALNVVGEVLADISRPAPEIDWVRQVENLEEPVLNFVCEA